MSDIEDQGSFRASEGTMLERMAWRMAYEWAAGDFEERDARLIADIEWIEWADIARAALEAIREPSDAVEAAAYDTDYDWGPGGTGPEMTAAICWRTMIDAILEGEA